jgi:hypothetical protein
MAGRGPAPKPAAARARRNKTPEESKVAADGKLRGPTLPAGFDWCDRTRKWWDVWRRSAQSLTFTPTDWEFLAETAVLHNELWNGNGSVAAELRLREAKLGATREDRLRLRIDVENPDVKMPQSSQNRSRYGHLRPVAGE